MWEQWSEDSWLGKRFVLVRARASVKPNQGQRRRVHLGVFTVTLISTPACLICNLSCQEALEVACLL